MVNPLINAYGAFLQILQLIPGPIHSLILFSGGLFLASRLIIIAWEVKR